MDEKKRLELFNKFSGRGKDISLEDWGKLKHVTLSGNLGKVLDLSAVPDSAETLRVDTGMVSAIKFPVNPLPHLSSLTMCGGEWLAKGSTIANMPKLTHLVLEISNAHLINIPKELNLSHLEIDDFITIEDLRAINLETIENLSVAVEGTKDDTIYLTLPSLNTLEMSFKEDVALTIAADELRSITLTSSAHIDVPIAQCDSITEINVAAKSARIGGLLNNPEKLVLDIIEDYVLEEDVSDFNSLKSLTVSPNIVIDQDIVFHNLTTFDGGLVSSKVIMSSLLSFKGSCDSANLNPLNQGLHTLTLRNMDSVNIDLHEWVNLKYLNVFAKKITLNTPSEGGRWSGDSILLTASDIIRIPHALCLNKVKDVRWIAPYIAGSDLHLKGVVALDFKDCKEVLLASGNEDLNYDWDQKGSFTDEVIYASNWQRGK